MEERLDQQSEGAPAVTDVEELYGKFNSGLAQAVAIAAAAIIPVGLIISLVFGGWRGFAGAIVGFGVASLYAMAAFASLKWALKKPPAAIPTAVLATFTGLMVAVAAVLYGLTFATAINRVAVYCCFAALFIAYTVLEVVFALRTFGVSLKKPG
jgi:hypothetical protein